MFFSRIDSSDRSVRFSSILLGHKQICRAPRKPPPQGRLGRGGQALAAHDTWSNTQLMALVQTHTCLIHDYKCAEQQPQHDAPASPAAAAQVPQAPKPLLIPPLNRLALLLAARAPGENAGKGMCCLLVLNLVSSTL